MLSDFLQPHRLQHARPPWPSPSPGVCLSSCSLHWRCRPAILSSDTLFSFCPWAFPASGTSPMGHLFASDDQNTGASASAWVLPVNIQGWSPLRLTGLISLLSKGVSQGSSLAHFFTCTTTIYSTTLFMTFCHLPVTVRALHKSPNCRYTLKNRLFAPYSPGLGTG